MGVPGEIYNIGGSEEKTNLEVIQQILNQLGMDTKLIKHIEDRVGHDRRYSMDSSKLSRELEWEPRISFHDGIKRTIEWYKQSEPESR